MRSDYDSSPGAGPVISPTQITWTEKNSYNELCYLKGKKKKKEQNLKCIYYGYYYLFIMTVIVIFYFLREFISSVTG